jgi:hypothetical protein
MTEIDEGGRRGEEGCCGLGTPAIEDWRCSGMNWIAGKGRCGGAERADATPALETNRWGRASTWAELQIFFPLFFFSVLVLNS